MKKHLESAPKAGAHFPCKIIGRLLVFPALLALLVLQAGEAQANDEPPAHMQAGYVQRVDLGSAKLLSMVDAPTTFAETLLAEEYRPLMPKGTFHGVVKTWLLQAGDKTILVDTGFGGLGGHDWGTLKILEKEGVAPEDVTDIILTHLDSDHIGGLAKDGKPVFPNAVVHVSKLEHDAWKAGKTNRGEEGMDFAMTQLAPCKVETYVYDEEILPGITARDAHGHTPGHATIDLVFDNERFAILGDIMHIWTVQLANPDICTGYDMTPEEAAASRKATFERHAKDGTLLGGMHFPNIGRLTQNADGSFTLSEEVK